jgi:hypothetical protein
MLNVVPQSTKPPASIPFTSQIATLRIEENRFYILSEFDLDELVLGYTDSLIAQIEECIPNAIISSEIDVPSVCPTIMREFKIHPLIQEWFLLQSYGASSKNMIDGWASKTEGSIYDIRDYFLNMRMQYESGLDSTRRCAKEAFIKEVTRYPKKDILLRLNEGIPEEDLMERFAGSLFDIGTASAEMGLFDIQSFTQTIESLNIKSFPILKLIEMYNEVRKVQLDMYFNAVVAVRILNYYNPTDSPSYTS